MTRSPALCHICYSPFTPDNERGAHPKRCSKASCQQATGPSDEHGVYDAWGRHFTDSLQELAARICQKDPEAFLQQVAELRDLTDDLTRVAVFKARMRHNMSWGDIGRILKFDGKTVARRWAPGNTLAKMCRKLGIGSTPEDGAPGPGAAPGADTRPPSAADPVPRYFLHVSQPSLTAWWPPPSWPTWPAAVWPSASVKDPQPDRTGR